MANTYNILLCANGLWFSAGFYFFTFRSASAAQLILKRKFADDNIFNALAYSLKFLGGLNLAFAIFTLLVILQPALFPAASQKIAILSILAFAHATQFILNVPQALKERFSQKPLWPVLKGRMLFIFITDGVLCLFNITLAFILH
jgi:hypothetical protein